MKKSLVIFSLLAMLSGESFAKDRSWLFDVYLDEDPIGEHLFVVSEKDNKKIVNVTAKFEVKFLFITAYTYRHTNKEVWESQCLQSIESHTDDNGTNYQVSGSKVESSLRLTTSVGSDFIDGCVRSFSYWDPEIVKQTQLLNSQTGGYEKVKIENLGKDQINVKDQLTNSNHYRLYAKAFSIDLWYSDKGEWLSLKSTTKDGNVLTYKLRSKT